MLSTKGKIMKQNPKRELAKIVLIHFTESVGKYNFGKDADVHATLHSILDGSCIAVATVLEHKIITDPRHKGGKKSER